MKNITTASFTVAEPHKSEFNDEKHRYSANKLGIASYSDEKHHYSKVSVQANTTRLGKLIRSCGNCSLVRLLDDLFNLDTKK